MARVTVEDCVDKISNRFELLMLAAQRSREKSAGSELTVERDNDKNHVVALREIADETVSVGDLKDGLVGSLQKFVEVDEPEDDDALELLVETTLASEAVEDLQAMMGQGLAIPSRAKVGIEAEESVETEKVDVKPNKEHMEKEDS